ncbi:MAG: GspE/PulE family protein [Patescibacteria group bacterium]
MLPEPLSLELLASEFAMDEKILKKYRQESLHERKTLEQYLIDEALISENHLYEKAAVRLNVPFVTLRERQIPGEVLDIVPPELAEAHGVIAFEKNDVGISLAMLDPGDLQTIEFLRRKTGCDITPHLTTPSDMKFILRKVHHEDIEKDSMMTQFAETDALNRIDGNQDPKKAAEELPIINIVNNILQHAVYEDASDIHIEPTPHGLSIRYRVDGILHTMMTLPSKVKDGIVARVKILANLKIDEHMTPQDGRIQMELNTDHLSFRVSIIPVYDGEKIVLRILHEDQKALTLDDLGLLPGPKKLVEESIKKPNGMMLVTGPTGSGKTTTLYTILNVLNQPGVNISTIEDPIEYHIEGINQSQVNPRVGFTFATGLRAFLRQDPNIIMVGEIRDQETAEIAIHAAMTGHLVLSTLHTNDAPTTLPRLTDMGVPPFLVAFTANLVMAQRLIRKICAYCKEPFQLDKTELDHLAKLIDTKTMIPLWKEHGVTLDPREMTQESMLFFRGAGCPRCGQTGYKGRIGIYEVLPIDKPLQKIIAENGTVADIRSYAAAHGMMSLLEDGLIKAKQGITTIEEILRVTKE